MKNLLLLLMFGSLAGCVSYQPQRLNTQSTLLNDIAHIRIDRSQMPLPELAAHEFNAEGGLDMMDVAMLAVVNNPDLKVARADAHVSQAQAFAAGLLPDPQFHFGLDFPRNALGAVTAFNMSLSEDINVLIQHDANRKAAQDEARKTDLNLLWQEWQVVAKARTLFVRVTQDQRLMEVLAKNRALFADRYDRTQSALDRGLLPLDAVTPHLSASRCGPTDSGSGTAEQHRQTRSECIARAGAGSAGTAKGPVMLPPLDAERVLSLLSDLPRRRPDLIALQYGYNAEDQRYRVAILGQFPTFNLGFTHGRDTTPIYTTGFGITLSVPIFNRNRGNIAIEQATRQKLYEDYQSRLNTANGDVQRILDEQRINERQLREVDRELADLSRAAAKADLAFRARNIDALVVLPAQSASLLVPGMRVKGTIQVGEHKAWAVPRQAVLTDDQGAYIFPVSQGRARRVNVTKGQESQILVAISGAMDTNLPVVVLGNYELQDGMKVREGAQ
jgi:outer membrane protein TolC